MNSSLLKINSLWKRISYWEDKNVLGKVVLYSDEGDVTEHLDLKSAKARYPTQRISIDFPKKIIEEVDVEAAKIGVTRTSLIKMWVAEHLSKQHASN